MFSVVLCAYPQPVAPFITTTQQSHYSEILSQARCKLKIRLERTRERDYCLLTVLTFQVGGARFHIRRRDRRRPWQSWGWPRCRPPAKAAGPRLFSTGWHVPQGPVRHWNTAVRATDSDLLFIFQLTLRGGGPLWKSLRCQNKQHVFNQLVLISLGLKWFSLKAAEIQSMSVFLLLKNEDLLHFCS